MKTEMKTNYAKRDEIIFGYQLDPTCYDIKHFEDLSYEKLKELVDGDMADPKEQQNDCPSIGEILGFLKENPRFTVHGYVVTPRRSDVRVSVEGVELRGIATADEIVNFTKMFRKADEFSIDSHYVRCWYD